MNSTADVNISAWAVSIRHVVRSLLAAMLAQSLRVLRFTPFALDRSVTRANPVDSTVERGPFEYTQGSNLPATWA